MKKFRTLSFTLLVMASVSLSGCSFFSSLFGGNKTPIELAPTELQDTYNDYMNNNFYVIDGCPTSGNPKLLVVPIWFTDSYKYIPEAQKEKVRNDIEKCYFGSDSDVGWKSVKTYYQQLSNGKLNLTGVVSDWYEYSESSQYFYTPSQGGERTTALVTEAVNHYKTSSGVTDLSSFDSDQNGYLDGVILIYASPDYGTLDKTNPDQNKSNMWAYCYWLQNPKGTPASPVPNTFFWASYDFIYGSNTKVGDYYAGDTRYCALDTHTFIHEMGHVLGLEDYYDYSEQYLPAGSFSMQDYNVGSHDPYSAMALGWANPMIPKESCTLALRPFQESHELILLSSRPSSVVSPFDEYILLEYYTATGLNAFDVEHPYLDQYPSGSKEVGIRLWHVDARLLEAKSRAEDERVSIVSKIRSGYYYTHAMSNTYYKDGNADYCSLLGPDYYDYNILQLISSNNIKTYKNTYAFSRSDLFTKGMSFKMSTLRKQFVNGDRMNDNSSLGWTFKVDKLTGEQAVITFTRS